MRVLLLTNNHMPPEEGIAGSVAALAQHLRARGVDAQILAKGKDWRRPDAAAANDPALTLYGEPPLRPFHHLAARPGLQRRLDALAPDILHVHWPMAPPLRFAGRLALTLHTPIASDVGAIDEKGIMPRLVKMNARLFAKRWERWYLERADISLAVSNSVAADAQADHPGLARAPGVLENGVDAAFFAYEGAAARRDLLYVGRLGYRKGLERLLRAFAALGSSGSAARGSGVLHLIGDGPLRAELERLAARLGVAERARFHGARDRAYVATALRRCALFVSPSDYEGCALSILEAMASGAPVAATAVGHARDLAAAREPTIFPARRDVDGLATTMEAALAQPAEARRRARAARDLIERRHDWRAVAARLHALYLGASNLGAPNLGASAP